MSKLNPVPPEAAAQSDLQTAFETAMEYKINCARVQRIYDALIANCAAKARLYAGRASPLAT